MINSFYSSQRLGAALLAALLLIWLFGSILITLLSPTLDSLLQNLLVLTLIVALAAIPVMRKSFQLFSSNFTERYWSSQKRAFEITILLLLLPGAGFYAGLALNNVEITNISLIIMGVSAILGVVYAIWHTSRLEKEEL